MIERARLERKVQRLKRCFVMNFWDLCTGFCNEFFKKKIGFCGVFKNWIL
jgi:hypothetical protein